jgi:predicted transcriptional regulator|tara:strand:- start:1139 stop:2107 length:969 start_codon:yes stop_codon:yes gene_type:complete
MVTTDEIKTELDRIVEGVDIPEADIVPDEGPIVEVDLSKFFGRTPTKAKISQGQNMSSILEDASDGGITKTQMITSYTRIHAQRFINFFENHGLAYNSENNKHTKYHPTGFYEDLEKHFGGAIEYAFDAMINPNQRVQNLRELEILIETTKKRVSASYARTELGVGSHKAARELLQGLEGRGYLTAKETRKGTYYRVTRKGRNQVKQIREVIDRLEVMVEYVSGLSDEEYQTAIEMMHNPESNSPRMRNVNILRLLANKKRTANGIRSNTDSGYARTGRSLANLERADRVDKAPYRNGFLYQITDEGKEFLNNVDRTVNLLS